MSAHILIVDDDEKICRLMQRLLERDGYDVTYCLSATQAIKRAQNLTIDLIITDIMMPEMDGRAFAETIRNGQTYFHKNIPIIMVSALYETADRVAGIKDGADDYLIKPFEPEELSVRIQALLRRMPPKQSLEIKDISDQDGCILSIEKQHLSVHNTIIGLSDKECHFLQILMTHINQPISKYEITRQLYPDLVNNPESRTAEVMIGRLRKKLEENNCQKIVTKRGDGYFWQV